MLNWSRMGVRTESRRRAALLLSTLRQNHIDWIRLLGQCGCYRCPMSGWRQADLRALWGAAASEWAASSVIGQTGRQQNASRSVSLEGLRWPAKDLSLILLFWHYWKLNLGPQACQVNTVTEIQTQPSSPTLYMGCESGLGPHDCPTGSPAFHAP